MQVNHRHALVKHVVLERWWHKFVGINDEKRVATAVAQLKKRWEVMKEATAKVDGILEQYGVGNHEETIQD